MGYELPRQLICRLRLEEVTAYAEIVPESEWELANQSHGHNEVWCTG